MNNVFSSMAWKFTERIASQLVSFMVSVILARLLLPEQYGIIAKVMVFISIADVFVTTGLCSALIQKKDSDDLDFSSMFYIFFVKLSPPLPCRSGSAGQTAWGRGP